jgi:hypothetical protein
MNSLPASAGREKAISFGASLFSLFESEAAILECVRISVSLGAVFLHRDDHHGTGCIADDFLGHTAH